MVWSFILGILVTTLVFIGAIAAISWADELKCRRQQKMVDAIRNDIIPAMWNEMDKKMDSMMDKVITKSVEMTKKMVDFD